MAVIPSEVVERHTRHPRGMIWRCEMEEMKQFTLYWRTGDREIVRGHGIADAFSNAGYGGGAIRALDFHTVGDNRDYAWNAETRYWDRVTPLDPTTPEAER
jgi:hypothetical protein